MAAVKMEVANNFEFHEVHRMRKQRDDGNPRIGINKKSLPTLQIIDMSPWYQTMLTRLRSSKRNCEIPEG